MLYRFFAILILIIPSITFASFSDVKDTYRYKDAINHLQDEGILNGFPDGSFRPDQRINRAEFVKIIVEKIIKDPAYKGYFDSGLSDCLAKGTYNYFSDVPYDAWFAGYVCFAQQLTLIQGYADKTFRPDTSIIFTEAASILSDPGVFITNNNLQKDFPRNKDPWYHYPITFLAINKAIPPSVDSINQYITRGEMAEMIYRLSTSNFSKNSRTYEELTK